MNRKIIQLKKAISCGLIVPTSVISNSGSDVDSVLDDESLIYKTLSSFLTDEKLIYTNKIDKGSLLSKSDEIALAPGIFQQQIDKHYELRVVVVGDELFVAKVDSQKYEDTKLDWRYNQNEYMFTESSLSPETANKLKKFHRESGLTFATYDFIVDKNDREIFLECNPCGQWLFVGDKLGEPITASQARQLLL